MQYLLNNWQKDLKRRDSLILMALLIFLFIGYEYVLFSRFSAQRGLRQASNYLEKARSLNNELTVEKSLFYQKALKLLKNASDLNPGDARLYFEYAEIASEIGNDTVLSGSFDLENFYNLSRLKYIEAIFREPTNAVYHQRLGSIYDKLLKDKEAEEEFNKAVLLDPRNIRIRLYLMQYFLIKNKNDYFFYHANQALEIYKNIPGSNPAGEIEDFFRSIGRQDLIKI